ncbi:hypothetical protein [Agrobacterium tumefaciens]|uniref:hyaluronate lyase N-terminal domain-containing protein n=1 Tax=Agrobacterium tumefaciens TaxID=358 RepID=UPI0021CE6F27|nr:hypothetical protein [Agrobacterium tumefaciens]UXS23110.1 hypothetical protein FY153_01085 [Agrobacterium tumefaciens]
MATEIRFRRGTTAQHAAFTGALAEITVDTDKKTAVVHDGATPGGFPLVSSVEIDNMMDTQVYDPQGIADDAFDRANHTGQQAISTVAGLQALLDIMGKGYLRGLTLSNNVADPTNDIDFAAGVCASDSAAAGIMQHAAGTAQLDVAYGSGNGGRFDAAISDGTWHCFVISDGNTVSRGFSKSLDPTTQPNYPAGFTRYRRVGSPAIRVAGVLKPFSQNGNEVLWKTAVGDVVDSSPGTAAKTRTLTVPIGIPVDAKIRVLSVGVNQNFRAVVSSLDQNDEAVGPNANAGGVASGGSNGQVAGSMTVRTNASGQIRSRGESASGCELYITTEGYIDRRGQN